jgi:8-oxo-dGTP diphosphatase
MKPVQMPIEVAIAVLWRRQPHGVEVLIARRKPGAHLENLWELPGGKVEAGETPVAAAAREALEEVGLAVDALEPLRIVEHAYDDRAVVLHAFISSTPVHGEARPLQAAECRWAPLASLDDYEWPAANRPILEEVRRRLATS